MRKFHAKCQKAPGRGNSKNQSLGEGKTSMQPRGYQNFSQPGKYRLKTMMEKKQKKDYVTKDLQMPHHCEVYSRNKFYNHKNKVSKIETFLFSLFLIYCHSQAFISTCGTKFNLDNSGQTFSICFLSFFWVKVSHFKVIPLPFSFSYLC